MQNKISDLNNHLFAQLEKLTEEDLSENELKKEIERSKAVSMIAANILDVAKVSVDAMKIISKGGVHESQMPKMLGIETIK